MKVRFTEAASRDLREIGDFIARRDPARALSFVREIRAAASRIGDVPLAHPAVLVSRGRAIRRRVHAGYLIFYVVGERTVDVIRVVHGARDARTLITGRD